MNWWKNLKGSVRLNEPLKRHTTFRIGGPAAFFIQPADLKDLRLALSLARQHGLRLFLLGAGSNILASDRGVKGVVLRLSSLDFRKLSRKNDMIEAGSGVMLSSLVRYALKSGLSGVEFLAAIPGTVGGALAMNAGAWGNNIGGIIREVRVMDYDGKVSILPAKNIKFGYRRSSLEKVIILGCTFKLAKGEEKDIQARIKKYISLRRDSQDVSFPNAGCVFKNPSPQNPAGRLIELCALKNKNAGGAGVSAKHANFIVNRGNAKAGDVLRLMELIKTKVRQKSGINLKPEIKIWR